MKCKNCGTNIAKGDRFCQQCGTPVDYSQNNKKTGLIIAACAAAFVVLIVVAVVIFSALKDRYMFDDNPDISVFEQDITSEVATSSVAEQTTFNLVGDIETTTASQNKKTYYVSQETPDSAGIVVREEGTYYSNQITILPEGAPVNVSENAARQGEYVQISFDFNGTETYGWVLEKYLTEKMSDANDNFNQTVNFVQKEANLYVSNITESGISAFSGRPSDAELVNFVMKHAILNYNPSVSEIEYGNYNVSGKKFNVRVSADYGDRLIQRFFDVKTNAADIKSSSVDSGYIYGNSSGVSSKGVAVVTGVYSNSAEDKYKINFSVFLSDSKDESGYYSYTPERAKNDNSLTYISDGYVILQKDWTPADVFYKIIEYKK